MAVPKLLHPYAVPAREDFITLVKGEGAVVTDSNGKDYIDGLASLWYVQVGHGCQPIVDAVTAQMRKLATFHTFEKFANEPSEALAARIVEVSPYDDARVFLGNSGSEAVDTAMKLARASQVRAGHPERSIIVSRDRGYHGVNYGGMSAQGIAVNKEGFGPLLPEVIQVPADDIEGMATLFANSGDKIAAVITEPVQGAGGVWPPPDGYLEGLRRLCDQHGAYLIFDEVICGFGRLGTWFAAEHFGVTPDMITFAKGVTNAAVPMAGVMASKRIYDAFMTGPEHMVELFHGYTYSGHPLAAAAGLATLDVYKDEGLFERAQKLEPVFAEAMMSLKGEPNVEDIRTVGLLAGIDLAPTQGKPGLRGYEATERMYHDFNMYVRVAMDTLVASPPLIATESDIGEIRDGIAKVLRAVA